MPDGPVWVLKPSLIGACGLRVLNESSPQENRIMKKVTTLFLLTLIASLISITSFGQGVNPFVGTWDIDKSASDFGGSPVPQNMSRTYADLNNGAFMYLVATVDADGELGGSSATYGYDGRRYPIASITGGNQATITYRKINDRTVEYTVRVEDQITQIGAKTISPDGRVLRIAIQFPASEGAQGNQILAFSRR